MAEPESKRRIDAEELRKLGIPRNLIEEMVELAKLNLPEPTHDIYKGLERYYNFLRESFLPGLVKQCVGKKIGKRFKNADSAVRHVKVCLMCKAEIANFLEKIKQEFELANP